MMRRLESREQIDHHQEKRQQHQRVPVRDQGMRASVPLT
jgi:hypothetical protein